ncbi:DUF4836 family protein [Halosquirtibacter laminarini]|uniref:DUF4836 family protein n=1 Tax=Halosquirtibacter laminarini TaxID=3374600 RepID=A0AC61NDE7_9BACT|nr:DUF4836 family protein [Prolixibacteraceae bacterium]
MKTNRYFGKIVLGIAFSLSLIITSCSGPHPTDTIPSNSKIVASFDLSHMLKVAEVDDANSIKSLSLLDGQMQNSSKELKSLWENLLKNPDNSGISFDQGVYLFRFDNESKGETNGCSMIIKDVNKFKETVEVLCKDLSLTTESSNGLNMVHISSTNLVAWNDTHMLLISSLGEEASLLDKKVASLFTLDSDKCITSVDGFKELCAAPNDITIWGSGTNLTALSKFNPSLLLFKDLVKDCSMAVHVKFDDGQIVLNNEFYAPKEVKALLGKYWKDDFNKDLYKMFPENNIMISGMVVNFEQILENLKGESYYTDADDMWKQFAGTDIQTSVQSLGNSFMFSITDMNYTKSRFRKSISPVINCALDYNTKKEHKWLTDNLDKFCEKEESGCYRLTMGRNTNMYIAETDEVLFISSEKDNVLRAIGQKKCDSDFTDSKIASHFTSTKGFWYLDLDYNHYPETTKKLVDDSFDKMQKQYIVGNMALIQDIEITSNDALSSHVEIHLKNKKENSLKQIIHLVDESAMKFVQ